MRPVVCLITGTTPLGGAAEDALVERVTGAARAGVHLIQVRQPDAEARLLLRLVQRCIAAVASTAARVLVNDRLDVALAAGAHGVHLRAGSPPAIRVRAAAPAGFLVGRSVHGTAEAVRAAGEGGLDYLVLGTVFPSSSKPGGIAVGVPVLGEAAAAVPLPILAVGGVRLERLPDLGRVGAAGFAAIGLFEAAPPGEIMDAASRAFASPSVA